MMNYSKLPTGLQGGVKRYIEHGINPGHFLSAIIDNNLKEACARADDINRHLLFDICSWFYNEAPAQCWGSREKHERWIKQFQSGGIYSNHNDFMETISHD